MSNQIGQYASRTQFCELVLNGEYKGVYDLMEKIKRDNNRVDIAKLEPNEISGDDITGGYILEVETGVCNIQQPVDTSISWCSDYAGNVPLNAIFKYDYPKWDDIVFQQKEYIKAYIDSFETVLYNTDFSASYPDYNDYMDVNSFIDYLIIQEISRNGDGYSRSTFMHKDKNSNEGKLKMGPLWDFDFAYENTSEVFSTEGWIYEGRLFWYDKLILDTIFTNKLKCRWLSLRQTTLDTTNIFSVIDSISTYILDAQARNFEIWHFNGDSIPVELDSLKIFIKNRIAWIDDNLPGNCYCNSITEGSQVKPFFVVYPNPSNGKFIIKMEKPENGVLEIYDIFGKKIYSNTITNITMTIDLSSQPENIYFLKIDAGMEIFTEKIITQ